VSIAASGLTVASASASSATWIAPFGADQEAYLSVPTLPRTGNFLQVAVRVSTQATAGVSCYFVRVIPSTGVWELRRKVNGGTSVVMTSAVAGFSAGDSMGLKVVGSTLTAYRKPALGDWTSVVSVTDSVITKSGYVTFTLGDTTARGGAFGGGSL
jgi:hypothetical protein